MRSLQGILSGIYARVGVSSTNFGNRFTAANLIDFLNEEWHEIQEELREACPEAIMVSQSVALTEDTAYTLPDNCVRLHALRDRYHNDLPRIRYDGAGDQHVHRGYERDKQQITLRNNQAETFTMRYLVAWPDLLYGTASSGSTTTLVMPSSPTVGTPSGMDDDYIGLMVGISGGAGIGEIKEVTDYVGSTRTLTTRAFTATIDATSVFSILPPWPQLCDALLRWGCIARIPDEEISAKAASNGNYERARDRVVRWAESLDTEGENFTNAMERAIARETHGRRSPGYAF